MMNFSIKYRRLFFLSISLAGCLALAGQTLEQTRTYADSCFSWGDYTRAIREYNRVIFFSGIQASPDLFIHAGYSHFFVGENERAMHFFDRAYFASNSDSLKTEAVMGRVLAQLAPGKWELALADLYSIPNTSEEQTRRVEFLKGVCFWGMEQFDEASKSFVNAVPEGNEQAKEEIRALFASRKNLYRPNPRAALIMSILFPGAGQFYSGDIKNGLNSTLLNLGLLSLGVYVVYHQTWIDALVSVAPWFQRYYMGGYNRAETIAMEKRAARRHKVYSRVIHIIEDPVP
jgi:tetratricopeptide (TPR) repeat protein